MITEKDVAREFQLSIKEGYIPQVPSIVTHSTTCLTPLEWEAAEAEIGMSCYLCLVVIVRFCSLVVFPMLLQIGSWMVISVSVRKYIFYLKCTHSAFQIN